MPVNILQCTEHLPPAKDDLVPKSIKLRLRPKRKENPKLEACAEIHRNRGEELGR